MKIFLYILLILNIGMLFSCGDEFLDVTPQNELTDKTFWKSEDDADLALNGCYRLWESFTNIVLFDGASDNAYEKSNFGYMVLGNGTLTPASYGPGSWIDWVLYSDAGGEWASSVNWFTYARIRKYNNFLINIENVPMDAAKKEQYKAEVRFLRAYDYFWKVMLHGDMPLVTELVPAEAKLSRDPAETVKQFILDEMTAISSVLPIQNNIDSKGHVTRGAALALKARLELYMGNFAAAKTDAKAVIDMTCYELFPNYRTLFLEESEGINKEAILSVQYIVNFYRQALTQMILPAGDGGWSAINAVKSMVDAYECSNGKTIDDLNSGYDIDNPFKDRDPRMEMSLLHPGQLWNGRYYNTLDQFMPDGNPNPDYNRNEPAARSGMNIIKYVKSLSDGPGGWPPNFGGDIMVIRLAEMYLTYAEAAVETGLNTGTALQYINDIRARSGQIAATTLTKELVRRERRVELAFEGLRYFDIMRWNLGSTALNGPLYGSRRGTMDVNGNVTWDGDGAVVNDVNYIKLENRTFNSVRNYLFPIPQYELDANPNMTQNPGY